MIWNRQKNTDQNRDESMMRIRLKEHIEILWDVNINHKCAPSRTKE